MAITARELKAHFGLRGGKAKRTRRAVSLVDVPVGRPGWALSPAPPYVETFEQMDARIAAEAKADALDGE